MKTPAQKKETRAAFRIKPPPSAGRHDPQPKQDDSRADDAMQM
jgi:hypothetical protein